MSQRTKQLQEEWEKRDGPAVLTTVDSGGMANAIYVSEIWYEAETGFIVADNYFHKTRENIKNGSHGAVLFLTTENKSYQAKGTFVYLTEGAVFEKMKAQHDQKHPGVAAAVLKIEKLYSGAEEIL